MRASDQHIRDKIIQDTNNQIVIAGAGSGKTTLIVDKYINLIKQGMLPQKIVAITFTNKSADELKLRIAKKYKECFPDQPALPISTLPISTIHGFCNRIVQNHAFDFGYLPSYEVEQEEIQDRIQDCYSSILPTLVKKHPDLLIWKLLGWISLHHIYNWLTEITLKGLSLPDARQKILFPDFQPAIDTLQSQLSHCQSQSDQLLQKATSWLDRIKDIDKSNPLTWSNVLHEKIPSVTRLGNQTNWGNKETLGIARDAFSTFLGCVTDLQRFFSQQIIEDLGFLHLTLLDQYALYKKELQIIEPDDLLTYVQQLLQHESIWKTISSQVDYIFIDEFQDTDPIQAEIIIKLLSKTYPSKTSWQDLDIHSKLTVVGDPQQSIYRFRNASIETFFKAQQMIEKQEGKTYSIVQNFRSDPPIIDFVNQSFDNMQYFSSLVAKDTTHESSVNILQPDDTTQITSLSEARAQEADLIAEHLDQFFQTEKNFGPKDCVVLLPTFSHIDVYEKALSRHFHTLKQRKSKHLHPFFSSILTLLSYLEDPSPLHLQNLLRTPFFFHSLQDLHPLVFHEQLHLQHLPDSSLAATLETLQALYKESSFFCMDVFLSHIQSDLSQEEKNLFTWALEKISTHESQRLEETLVDFLQNQYIQNVMPLPVTDKTIRLMTIHQSKGLEFPMVVLAGLYSQAFKGQTYYSDPSQSHTELSFPPFSDWLCTDGFKDLKTQEKIAHMQEKQRLLYVACTRACHHLVAAKLDVQSRQKTFADLLWSGEKT